VKIGLKDSYSYGYYIMSLVSEYNFITEILAFTFYPYKIISIRNYTQLPTSIPGLEASPDIIL
jgi:hypothetical protein